MKVVGKVEFDFNGYHYLQTFDGRFLIPEETLEKTAKELELQKTPEEIIDTRLAGLLAVGLVLNDEVVMIRYLVGDQLYPKTELELDNMCQEHLLERILINEISRN